jgi:hypothetical protein
MYIVVAPLVSIHHSKEYQIKKWHEDKSFCKQVMSAMSAAKKLPKEWG